MQKTTAASIASLVIASAVTTACSLFMALLQAVFVPFVVEGTDVGARPPEQRIYTKEELDRAEREAKARIKARMEDKSFEARALILRSMQRPALWMSWIPWIVLPFVVPVAGVVSIALALVFPALMAATTTTPPEVVLVFGIALAIGTGVNHADLRRRAI